MPEDHIQLTIPSVGKLAGGIIVGVVNDVKRVSKPESFISYCGLDPVVERSGRPSWKGVSPRGKTDTWGAY